MLKKLLKYDVKSIWKLWVALSVGVLAMSFITSLIIRASIEINLMSEDYLAAFFLHLGAILMGLGSVLVWAGIFIVTPIMCYIRYYKNFFSDEGYLTFTLPVRRRDLYLAKVINVFMFSVGNIIVSLLAVMIGMLIIPGTENEAIINFAAYRELWELIQGTWALIGGWIFAYLLGLLLLAIACSLYQIGIIHLCITVGATVAKKHKVLAGVGIYFGSNFILSSLYQIFSMFGLDSLAGFGYLLDHPSDAVNHLCLLTIILLAVVIVSTLTVILHLVTLDTIERKLNLA